jgi:hypothetical protein
MKRKDALTAGLTTYETGKPCKHGHLSPRDTLTGVCLECREMYRRLDREKFEAARAETNSHGQNSNNQA